MQNGQTRESVHLRQHVFISFDLFKHFSNVTFSRDINTCLNKSNDINTRKCALLMLSPKSNELKSFINDCVIHTVHDMIDVNE